MARASLAGFGHQVLLFRRIRREEQLPVYERLGDVRSLLVGRTNLAINLLKRYAPGDRDEATQLLQLAYAEAVRLKLPDAAQIRRTQEANQLPTVP